MSTALAEDWETSIASSTAWMLVAHIRILIRRLARHGYTLQTLEIGLKTTCTGVVKLAY